MPNLIAHLLVPAILVDREISRPALQGIALPNLNQLTARAWQINTTRAPPTALFTTWQSWLLGDAHANSAAILAHHWGQPAGHYWLAEPVHLQVTHHDLLLADPADLAITANEAQQLRASAAPLLQAAGWQILPYSASRWLLKRQAPYRLQGAAAECAIDQGIGRWLPVSHNTNVDAGLNAGLLWQRLANEIQMTWFTQELNQTRSPAINALWLSGTGQDASSAAIARSKRYQRITSNLPFVRDLLPISATPTGQTLETFEQLIKPLQAQDWGTWRLALPALDARLGELLNQLRAGRLIGLSVILCGTINTCQIDIRRRDLWKIWRRGRVDELLHDPRFAS